MARVRNASLTELGSGGAGSRGRDPGREKCFCQFWPKVKDLNENLPPCLRQTVSRRYDQP